MLMTPAQAAHMIGRSEHDIKQAISAGELSAERVLVVDADKVLDWDALLRAETQARFEVADFIDEPAELSA